MADTTFAPIDARVVALDCTRHYSIDAKDAPYVERIEEVYLYDKNEHTHCCEFTPSYWLIHLYNRVIFTQAGDELDECAQDRLFQAYEYERTDDMYVHCRDIDAIEKKARRSAYHVHGDPGFEVEPDEFDSEEAYHDAVMESLREHFQANCPL